MILETTVALNEIAALRPSGFARNNEMDPPFFPLGESASKSQNEEVVNYSFNKRRIAWRILA